MDTEHRFGVVAFSFGTYDDLDSNKSIAGAAAIMIMPEYGFTAFTQRDVPLPAGESVTVMPEEDGKTPSTLEVARGAVAWAVKNDIDTLEIICARPHRWRCRRDMKNAAREIGARFTFDVYSPDPVHHSWFEKESRQWWTRNRLAWTLRETAIFLTPFFIYRKLAA